MAPPEESGPRRRWKVELPHDHLPLVGCYVGLYFSCVGVQPRCIGCLGFWHDSLHVRALICLATRPLLFGLFFLFMLCFVFLHIVIPLMCISTNALLQMNKHQNSWNSLVVNPITMSSVHLCGFFVSVGG
jgi:hypothetical protein